MCRFACRNLLSAACPGGVQRAIIILEGRVGLTTRSRSIHLPRSATLYYLVIGEKKVTENPRDVRRMRISSAKAEAFRAFCKTGFVPAEQSCRLQSPSGV